MKFKSYHEEEALKIHSRLPVLNDVKLHTRYHCPHCAVSFSKLQILVIFGI